VTLTPGLRSTANPRVPPRAGASAGAVQCTEDTFPAVDDVVTWNLFAPRIGLNLRSPRQRQDGPEIQLRTLLVEPERPDVRTTQLVAVGGAGYSWTDPNKSGVWEPGEEGTFLRSQAARPRRRSTGSEGHLHRRDRRVVRARADGQLRVRAGFVYRAIRQRYASFNTTQPFSAFTVPVQIPDPGPTGDPGNATTARRSPLQPRSDAGRQAVEERPDELGGAERLLHLRDQRHEAHERPVVAHDGVHVSLEPRRCQRVLRQLDARERPAGDAERPDQHGVRRHVPVHDVDLQAEQHHRRAVGRAHDPMLRHQAGQTWGRTFVGSFNYGNIRVLAEPLDTRRQDKPDGARPCDREIFRMAKGRSVSGFLDLYNITNSNAEQNITWSSGTSFLRPLTIISPRIARFGAKFQW